LTEIRIQRVAGSGYFKKAPKSSQFWAFQKVQRADGFHERMDKNLTGFRWLFEFLRTMVIHSDTEGI
jgi:hypothetical protein